MSVLRLYPTPQEQTLLEGLYLGLDLHRQAADGDVLIYSNYIASMDGRISLRDANSNQFIVPKTITNKRDWRLYQELAAQADVIITSARYFRQLAKGQAQDLLPVGKAYADLLDWRHSQGLDSQPAIAIVSNSLDIPAAALDMVHGRDIYVFTTKQADPAWEMALKRHGAHVIHAGSSEGVDGGALRQRLAGLGFSSAYMIAGPQVHGTLIKAGALDRLFLTMHHTLLGGGAFHTILQGEIAVPSRLKLKSLYLDAEPDNQQMFAQYSLR
ncbi:MAG: dihydrofolate reductase family protein [Mariprofundaceae bacterium]|nr:dihydrofolate reductase family protein [Mariprofundaceae bacterium]